MENFENEEELIEHASFGQLSAIKKLLGINPKLNVDYLDRDGMTAAIIAAKRNDFEMLKLLSDSGADLTIMDQLKQSALFWANQNSNDDMANFIRSTVVLNSKISIKKK